MRPGDGRRGVVNPHVDRDRAGLLGPDQVDAELDGPGRLAHGACVGPGDLIELDDGGPVVGFSESVEAA